MTRDEFIAEMDEIESLTLDADLALDNLEDFLREDILDAIRCSTYAPIKALVKNLFKQVELEERGIDWLAEREEWFDRRLFSRKVQVVDLTPWRITKEHIRDRKELSDDS